MGKGHRYMTMFLIPSSKFRPWVTNLVISGGFQKDGFVKARLYALAAALRRALTARHWK